MLRLSATVRPWSRVRTTSRRSACVWSRTGFSRRRPDDPINFEQTVEQTILSWRDKFLLRKVYFDPFQLVSVMQRLQRAGGVKVQEYAQTIPALTAATQNLYDLIASRSLMLYPDAAMRLAISRA